MKQPTVTLGSCYLDKGEDINYVREQLVRMADQHPDQYFFDVICTPDQVGEAADLVKEFYYVAAEVIPSVTRENIYVGITCDDSLRPAATLLALMTHMSGKSIKVKDINPDRKPR